MSAATTEHSATSKRRKGHEACPDCLELRRQYQVDYRARKAQERAGPVKTHCPWGHPYSGANLGHNPNGGRTCRHCRRIASRAHGKLGVSLALAYALYPEWLDMTEEEV
jgi:hypothetical protein